MQDITSRADIEILVNTFYQQVKIDTQIGHFFNQVVVVDWDHHLPKMYDFWESILFGTGDFKGNPMARHFQINQIHPMLKEDFDHWLSLWNANVDAQFAGEKAEEIKQRAGSIAGLMSYKILEQSKLNQ